MRLYRALLHLYPASFRAEYGEEMCAVLTQRQTSLLSATVEVLRNAPAVHWDILRQDLCYAARTLARAPGFTAVAILVLALGIGANTAVFSVTDYVLIRPLPFLSPDRLVRVWEKLPGYRQMELSPVNYRDWRRMNTVFEDLAAVTTQEVNLIGESAPERVKAALVTGNLFSVLGVPPLLGHSIGPADDRDGAPRTVVLSYGVWQRAFGGDTGVLGHKLDLNGTPHVVIGVMPPEFRFPNQAVDLWMPFAFPESAYSDRNNNYLDGIGRLRNGVTLQQARAEMNLIADQLRRQYPKELENTGASVNVLRDDEIPDQRRLLLLALAGAALCVLLIACSNLANLLLARALVRERELAVRTAIGAGRARLVPYTLPVEQASAFDWRVLLFAGLLTALTGVVFGVAPAWRVCRKADLTGLREGARAGSGKKERLRSALVMAEVTASVVLLVSTGLLLRALWKLQGVDPGFRTEGVLTLRTALSTPKYDPTALRANFYNRVMGGIRQLPGVTDAAYISFLPMAMGGGIWPVQ